MICNSRKNRFNNICSAEHYSSFDADKLKWLVFAIFAISSVVLTIFVDKTPYIRNKIKRIPDNMRKAMLLFMDSAMFIFPLLPQPRIGRFRKLQTITGMSLMFTSLTILSSAYRSIGLFPSMTEEKGLCTNGIYGLCRHPVYLGYIVFVTGWTMTLKSLLIFLIVPVHMIGILSNIKNEENQLVKIYCEKYVQYQKKVPALLPGIRVFLNLFSKG